MMLVEMTTEEAIKFLQKSQSEKILFAVEDLGKDEDAVFQLSLKNKCIQMIEEAKTIAALSDDFVEQLRLFTEKQKDLHDIIPVGKKITILLRI